MAPRRKSTPPPPPLVKRRLVDLHPLEGNPRTRKDEAFRALVESISTPAFGVEDGAPCALQPLVVNKHPDAPDTVVGGHRRLEAALEAGFTEIWTREAHLDVEQMAELAVRLNVSAGDWDWELLIEHGTEKLGEWGFTDLELPPALPEGGYDVTVAPPPVDAVAQLAQLREALGAETIEQALEVAATLGPASTTREDREPTPEHRAAAPGLGWVLRGRVEDVLPTLEAESFDLIVADPPYFQVLMESWDRQWPNADAFLDWLGQVADEWRRVLKLNGSLYCWSSARLAARIEAGVIGSRFDVLSSITWVKEASSRGPAWRNDRDRLRSWLPACERVIFAEHHGADHVALSESGYGAEMAGVRSTVFEPLRAYLDAERESSGTTMGQVDTALGNHMAGHYFGRSQWALPTADAYAKLQELFNRNGDPGHLRREYGHLRREYEDLRREYEDLRREYEDLRRPFFLTAAVEQSDVWTYASAPSMDDRHPAEKPEGMCMDIVRASSKEGGKVLDCFSGHGSLSLAAVALGRDVTAIEMDEDRCQVLERRVQELRDQP